MSNYQNIVGYKLAQAAMTGSYATVYTVPADTLTPTQSTRTFIKDITIINTTAAPINVYVHLVPVGDTASASNAIFYNNALPAYTTVQWSGVQILDAEDFISVKGSAVGCTITISGGQGT
jgi:hypothetical protein